MLSGGSKQCAIIAAAPRRAFLRCGTHATFRANMQNQPDRPTDIHCMRGYSKEPLRALIVEDDLPLQEILNKLLQSRGFVVNAVVSVAESLALFRTECQRHCLLLALTLRAGTGTNVLKYDPV